MTFTRPHSAFSGDTGEADQIVRSAIERVHDSHSYARAIVALCTARLIMPIIALSQDTAAVSVETSHGERALLGFTGVDAMNAWQSSARPMLCTLDDLAATVIKAEAHALLLDIAGPVSFTIEGDILQALSQGQRLVEFDDGSFAWVSLSQD